MFFPTVTLKWVFGLYIRGKEMRWSTDMYILFFSCTLRSLRQNLNRDFAKLKAERGKIYTRKFSSRNSNPAAFSIFPAKNRFHSTILPLKCVFREKYYFQTIRTSHKRRLKMFLSAQEGVHSRAHWQTE